jgi:hypothetical protein
MNLLANATSGEAVGAVDTRAPLPPIWSWRNQHAPGMPSRAREVGISDAVLRDLSLNAAYTVGAFTTEWIARELRLTEPSCGEPLEQLNGDPMLEILGSSDPGIASRRYFGTPPTAGRPAFQDLQIPWPGPKTT